MSLLGFNNTINVLQKGVVGDGSVDDGPAIQSLINLYSGSGIALYFPTLLGNGSTPANYLHTTTVNAKSNITLLLGENAIMNGNIAGATTANVMYYYTFASLATGSTTVNATVAVFGNTMVLASVAGIVANVTWVGVFAQTIGVRGGFYKVIAVNGGANTITVDRPILWPFVTADTVSIYNAVGPDGVTNDPTVNNFNIIGLGSGALFTGQCVAYANLVGATNCQFRNLKAKKGGAGTQLSSDAGFAMQIGYRNSQVDMYIDGTSLNSPNKGFPLVAQEAFLAFRCRAEKIRDACWGINDMIDGDFIDVEGNFSPSGFGFVLGTETSAVSGIQGCRWLRFQKLTAIGNNSGNLALGIGDSYNSFDGFLLAGGQSVGLDLNSGVGATPCESNKFSNGEILSNAGVGLNIPNHAIKTLFQNVRIAHNLAQDVLIASGGSDTIFSNFILENDSSAGARFQTSDNVLVQGFKGRCSVASTIIVQIAAGKCICNDALIEVPANSDAFYAPGGVLVVSNVKTTGTNSGTAGVQTNGGTARIGEGCDFDSTGTPLLNSAGYFSRGGSIVANGAGTPQDFTFPDAKTTDRVNFRLVTSGGTPTAHPPVYTVIAATKITVTFASGDTSTYEPIIA